MEPNLREEKKLWKKGYLVVGLDEAGRGALAGPVLAAATALIKNQDSKFKKLLKEIKDSKKLTPKKRKEIYAKIIESPKIKWGIGRVSEKIIDKINIFEATKLAMKRALKNLEKKLPPKRSTFLCDRTKLLNLWRWFLILDGNFKLDLNCDQKAIVDADRKVLSCALSSILAKVKRDKIMEKYHQKYPVYGFLKHKGYPTKDHLKKLKKYGPSKIHRKSYLPVKKMLK
jgi:ribonuclease HII